jgi:hypothetical protein
MQHPYLEGDEDEDEVAVGGRPSLVSVSLSGSCVIDSLYYADKTKIIE